LSLDPSYECSNVVKEQRVATAVTNAAKSDVTGEFLNELRRKFADEGLNISDEAFIEMLLSNM
jgi:N-methylhydantoinase A/oxoprolinase/acetone carboxylase beta subunit